MTGTRETQLKELSKMVEIEYADIEILCKKCQKKYKFAQGICDCNTEDIFPKKIEKENSKKIYDPTTPKHLLFAQEINEKILPLKKLNCELSLNVENKLVLNLIDTRMFSKKNNRTIYVNPTTEEKLLDILKILENEMDLILKLSGTPADLIEFLLNHDDYKKKVFNPHRDEILIKPKYKKYIYYIGTSMASFCAILWNILKA